MYILKRDFGYMERVYAKMDRQRKRRFWESLDNIVYTQTGLDILTFDIVSDEIFRRPNFFEDLMISRKQIDRAYRVSRRAK